MNHLKTETPRSLYKNILEAGELMRKLSVSDIKEIVEAREYILVSVRWERKCFITISDKNKYMYEIWVQNFKMGKIPEPFSISNKFVLKNISTWIKKNNKSFELCEDNTYERSTKKLKFYCFNKHYFYCEWSNIGAGHGCGVCNGKQTVKTTSFGYFYPELLCEWNNKNKVSPYEISPKSSKVVLWKCSACGNEWKSSIANRTRGGNGCPNCSSSRGEKAIDVFLKRTGLEYVPQYKFEYCKNILKLPFDFYIPHYNLSIEFHGRQHYEAIDFFGGEKEFDKRKINDKIKKKFCKDNNINLLVIPYTEFNNIEQILTDTLNSLEQGGN